MERAPRALLLIALQTQSARYAASTPRVNIRGVQKDPHIQSEADLEVVFLYETHDLLAAIIGPEYYHLLGNEVRFHSSSRFNDFFVHVDELFARGRENLPITPQPKRLSLFDAGGLVY